MKSTDNNLTALIGLAEREINRGNNEQALIAAERALVIAPANIEALKYLGNAYINLRKYDKSLEVFLRILELVPADAIALWAVSYSLYQLKRVQEIFPYISKCIETGVQLRGAYTLLGSYYLEHERNSTQAIKCFETEIALDPRSEKAYSLLANAYASRGEIDKSIEYLKKQIEINPTNEVANNNLVMYLHYSQDSSPEMLIEAAKQAYRNVYEAYAQKLSLSRSYGHLDLNPNKTAFRIGFVSGDFKKHAIFYWLRGLFQALRTEDFEVYCYCNNKEDEATELWKQEVKNWRNIKSLSDDQVVRLITEDAIDILIDLSGHTALNRLKVFINQPCPLQMSWLGQSGPLGVPQIDYMISDSYLVQEGEENQYTEKILRLPRCFAPFSKPQNDIKVVDAPCLANGYVTFGCFNNYMKVNQQVLDTWIAILNAVPDSRLVLKARAFADDQFCQEVRAHFLSSGIDQSRIDLTCHNRNRLEYLAAYNGIDIALDPFPVGGGTTTHDTLWMSTPLITLRGVRMSHRTSADLLQQISHNELITCNVNDYILKAIELAHDHKRIHDYKLTLRGEYTNSRMCDMNQFACDFRAAIKNAWKEKFT